MVALSAGGDILLAHCRLTLRWSVLARAKHLDQPAGDGYGIWRQHDGLLFAVADGTGSGERAADAVELCLDSLAASVGDIEQDFRTCHRALKGGRGAAMALVGVSAETGVMTWASVGDVDGVLMRRARGYRKVATTISCIGGILGSTFQGVLAHSQRLEPGDLIILTTDGIQRTFVHTIAQDRSAAAVAAHVLAEFRRPNDDSLVMAIDVSAAQ